MEDRFDHRQWVGKNPRGCKEAADALSGLEPNAADKNREAQAAAARQVGTRMESVQGALVMFVFYAFLALWFALAGAPKGSRDPVWEAACLRWFCEERIIMPVCPLPKSLWQYEAWCAPYIDALMR